MTHFPDDPRPEDARDEARETPDTFAASERSGDALDQLLAADVAAWRARVPAAEQFAERMDGLLREPSGAHGHMMNLQVPQGATVAARPLQPLRPTSPHVRRGLAAVMALVAVVALLVGMFQIVALRRGAPSISSTPGQGPLLPFASPNLSPITTQTAQQCDPTRIPPGVPGAHVVLSDIAMVSATEGWAVGELDHYAVQGQAAPSDSVLMHLSQGQWTQATPVFHNASLSNLAMLSPDDGWAVGTYAAGDTAFGNPRVFPLVLHYTGGAWHQVQVPAHLPGYDVPATAPSGSAAAEGEGWITRIKISMVSADDGWLWLDVNASRDPANHAARSDMRILHYHAGTWSLVPLPPISLTTDFWNMAAAAPGDAWFVGTDYQNVTPVLAHYAAGRWSVIRETFAGQLMSIGMSSATNGWATGEDGGISLLMHYDGTTWSRRPLPPLLQTPPSSIADVFITRDGQVWVVGLVSSGQNYQTIIEEYYNGAWGTAQWPYSDVSVRGIAPAGSHDLWFIGAIGYAWGCAPADVRGVSLGVLAHYQNGTWSEQHLP